MSVVKFPFNDAPKMRRIIVERLMRSYRARLGAVSALVCILTVVLAAPRPAHLRRRRACFREASPVSRVDIMLH
jgi:hypothetical protein